MLRLDKYLSELGIGSRKEIKAFIKEGLVRVENAEHITNDMKINEESAVVYFNGERLIYKKFLYLMMNKPPGVISATYDPAGEETVIDLLPEEFANFGLFPVGRLDKDTVGLLLLTNDGRFSHLMTSPKRDIAKLYYAIITGEPDKSAFSEGITLEDGYKCKPASVFTLEEYNAQHQESDISALCRKGAAGKAEENSSEVLIEISEGKYHQIKRMFEITGQRVLFLKRVKHGNYTLPYDLDEGDVIEICVNQ